MDRNFRNWTKAVVTALMIGTLALGTVAAAAQTAQEKGGAGQAQAAEKAPAKAKKAPKAKLAEGTKINVNSATAEQLDQLPRVGPKVAQRIVEYRTAHKGFRTVDELRNVKGVGPKVLEAIRPYVTL